MSDRDLIHRANELAAASPGDVFIIHRTKDRNLNLIHCGDNVQYVKDPARLDGHLGDALHQAVEGADKGDEGAWLEADETGCEDRILLTFRSDDEGGAYLRGVAWRKIADTPPSKAIIDALDDPIWIKDLNGHFVDCNRAFEKATGIERQSIIGRNLLPPVNGVPFAITAPDDMAELKRLGETTVSASIVDQTNGSYRKLEIRKRLLLDAVDEPTAMVAVARDITVWRNLENELDSNRKKLSELAFSDPETGLPNRRHALGRLGALSDEATTSGRSFTLLLLTPGQVLHNADEGSGGGARQMAIEIARRLQAMTGDDMSYVARSGNTEFLVVMPGDSKAEAAKLAQRILKAVLEPFFVEGRYVSVAGSIGIAVCPEHTRLPETLLSFANIAAQEARRIGDDGFVFFNESLNQSLQQRYALERELKEALEKGQLEAFYQAKFDLNSGEITGVEALMRWNNPERGHIPPSIFIPLAEETGLILPMGEKIIRDACKFVKDWNTRTSESRRVAVNLSPRQLIDESFYTKLRDILEETGCRPDWLELDITENLLLSDQKQVTGLMRNLAELGVHMSIDDFGTGYSAMSYLTSLPINTLKLDRSLVRAASTDHRSAALVRGIISIAHGLGMSTVAEGVETREVARWMQEAGCMEGQGFLWNRPSNAEAFLTWAEAYEQRKKAAS